VILVTPPRMERRPTRRRHSPWERIKVHPRGDREKIAALKADMMRAFMDLDLDTLEARQGTEVAAHPGKIWEALIRRASCQANQESEMPIFITQGRYTQSALTGMIASPESRAEGVEKMITVAVETTFVLHDIWGVRLSHDYRGAR
jgi:hypothetical protein